MSLLFLSTVLVLYGATRKTIWQVFPIKGAWLVLLVARGLFASWCLTDFGCVNGGATSSEGSAHGAQKLLTRGHLPFFSGYLWLLVRNFVHMGLTWAAFQALGNTWDTEVGLSSSNPHQPWRRDPSLKEAPDFASEVRMCQDVVGQLRRCQLSKLPVSYACVRLGPTTCTPSVPLCSVARLDDRLLQVLSWWEDTKLGLGLLLGCRWSCWDPCEIWSTGRDLGVRTIPLLVIYKMQGAWDFMVSIHLSEPDFIGQRLSKDITTRGHGITLYATWHWPNPLCLHLPWLCDLPGQENSPDTSHLIIIAARASFSYLKSQEFKCK